MGETWILRIREDDLDHKDLLKRGNVMQGGVKREGETREQSTPREPPALVKKPKLSTSPK